MRKYCIPCKEWRHANEWQYPYFPLKTIRFRKKFSEQCKEHITIAKNCWIRSRGGEGQIFVGGDWCVTYLASYLYYPWLFFFFTFYSFFINHSIRTHICFVDYFNRPSLQIFHLFLCFHMHLFLLMFLNCSIHIRRNFSEIKITVKLFDLQNIFWDKIEKDINEGK